jgi:hypothetical protein
MNPLLAGEVGGGQPTAIQRRQKLSAPGGNSPGRARRRGGTRVCFMAVFLSRPADDDQGDAALPLTFQELFWR